jgi:sugar phosphate isomerase/epimerase
MKYSLVIAPETARPPLMAVYRDEIAASLAKAAAFGYNGVEIALVSGPELDWDAVAALLRRYQLTVSVLSTGRIFSEAQLYFSHPAATIRREAVQRVQAIIAVAGRFGSKVSLSRVRGPLPENQKSGTALARVIECIRECADYALPLGVELLLEPVNRYELNFIHSLPEGLGFLERLERPNVRLLADVFHMNIEDVSIEGDLLAAGKAVGYLHFADSNRLAPGRGHLDFTAILRAAAHIGYDGFISLEMLPLPDPDRAARTALEYLRSLPETR